jgi:hypothetical protein
MACVMRSNERRLAQTRGDRSAAIQPPQLDIAMLQSLPRWQSGHGPETLQSQLHGRAG